MWPYACYLTLHAALEILNADFQRANAMMGMQQSYFQRLLLDSGNDDNLTEEERVKRLRIRRQIKLIRYVGNYNSQPILRVDLR